MPVPAYGSIVGAGANACVLHYLANNAAAAAGDLVLVDAGAEYAATRPTSPARFRSMAASRRSSARCTTWCSPRRRRRLAQARPGAAYEAGHEAAVRR